MDKETYEELCKSFEEEKKIRKSLEEENNKLKNLLNGIESQFRQKNQEFLESKKEYEEKLFSAFVQIGKLQTNEENYQKELKNLQVSFFNLKTDYMKSTETGIEKAKQVEGLFLTIDSQKNEVFNLRSQVLSYQSDLTRLQKDNEDLLKAFNTLKANKFSQTKKNFLISQESNQFSNKKTLAFTQSHVLLPAEYSLSKAKNQMNSLQRSKARLDKQIKLLESLSEIVFKISDESLLINI